jgi:hypothetical protein
MSKMNLQDSFKNFCAQNKFEINTEQINTINLLDTFINKKETFLSRFLKKKKNFVFIYMEK